MKNTLIGPKLTNWEEEKGKTNFLYFINTKGRKEEGKTHCCSHKKKKQQQKKKTKKYRQMTSR